jgi:hypothetical protein
VTTFHSASGQLLPPQGCTFPAIWSAAATTRTFRQLTYRWTSALPTSFGSAVVVSEIVFNAASTSAKFVFSSLICFSETAIRVFDRRFSSGRSLTRGGVTVDSRPRTPSTKAWAAFSYEVYRETNKGPMRQLLVGFKLFLSSAHGTYTVLNLVLSVVLYGTDVAFNSV